MIISFYSNHSKIDKIFFWNNKLISKISTYKLLLLSWIYMSLDKLL